jgi:hypothetical protein
MKSVVGLLRAALSAFPWIWAMVTGGRARRASRRAQDAEGRIARLEAENEIGDLSDTDVAERLRRHQE